MFVRAHQIPTISKAIDYNPDGMMFIICDDDPGTIAALGEDIEYILGGWVISASYPALFYCSLLLLLPATVSPPPLTMLYVCMSWQA